MALVALFAVVALVMDVGIVVVVDGDDDVGGGVCRR